MPERRSAQSWRLPHALVASPFVLMWEQSDHKHIHTSPTSSGLTPGVLLRATVRTMSTARYVV
jgi:hypothetical protein